MLVAIVLALDGADAARADCRLVKLGELPVTMDGVRPIVSAKINGADIRFLADTGAFYSTLSEASAHELKLSLREVPFEHQMVGVGGASTMSETIVEDFQLNQIPVKHIEFIVGGSEVGSHAVGVLGENIWSRFDTDYDFAAGEIRLMHAQDCSRTALAYWAAGKPFSIVPIQAADDANPRIVGRVLVNGVEVQATFDTGASRSIISLEAAARAGLRPTSPGVVRAGASVGVGRRATPMWLAPFASVQIGDEQVRNTKLFMAELGLQNVGMLIGADFFLSHHVFVANSQRKIYFTYSGGSVFDMSTPPAAETEAPLAESLPPPVPPAPEDLLLPGGQPIGQAGSSAIIREVQGGVPEAQALFNQLTAGGTPVSSSYPGTLVQLENGGTLGLRTYMTTSPGTAATIDVNMNNIPFTKIKFNP